jgi:hypothetical protein
MNLVTEGKQVRDRTSAKRNMEIDEMTFENIRQYAGKSEEEITQRIKELDNEWDVDRVLGIGMSAVALAGVALTRRNRRGWLTLPATALGFFAQHAWQGWCPPVTLLRALKVRTRDEIDQEKHALKALRGDYKHVSSPGEAYIAARKLEP